MKNNQVYLTYKQVMILLLQFQKMREANPYFKSELVYKFEEYVVIRTIEIQLMPRYELQKYQPFSYVINSSLYEYLKRLSGIDVFDLKSYLKYKKEVEDYERKVVGDFSRKYLKE